jgi:peptidoglycan/LPS O-acetylase OafA/YrhL
VATSAERRESLADHASAEPSLREPQSGDGARFTGINALRAAIVLVVISFHVLLSAPGPAWLTAVIARLSVTISLFFVLSGFLVFRPIAVGLYRQRAVNLVAYARNRVLRVMPLYLVVLVAAFLLYPARRLLPLYATTLTFTGTYMDWKPYALLHPVSWTLDDDVWFYAVLPVLYLGVRRLAPPARRFAAMAAVVGLLGVASFALQAWVILSTGMDASLGYSSNLYRMLPSQFHIFAAGMLLAMAQVRWGRSRLPGWFVPSLASLAVATLAVGYLTFTSSYVTVGLLEGVGFSLLVGALVFADPRSRMTAILEFVPLAYVGELSYGVYLWHALVLHFIRDDVHALPHSFGPALGLVYLVTIGLATLTYEGVERQALKRKKLWLKAAAA